MIPNTILCLARPALRKYACLLKPLPLSRQCSALPQANSSLEHQVNERDLQVKAVKKINPETLRVTFDNHSTCDFNHVWLRDSCQCPMCIHPVTRQKLVNIRDLDLSAEPLSVNIQNDSPHSALEISWPEKDGKHRSVYSAQWLSQFTQAFKETDTRERLSSVEYASALPPQQLWNKENIENVNLEVPYNEFMNQHHGLFMLLSHINAYGIAIIRDVPLEMGHVLKVARRISFVKQTTYGLTFQVISKPDPKTHLSYTNRRFELHTDLSYMQNAPSIQLLHCLEASSPDMGEEDAGGISFFADAFHSARWLRQHHPDYFKILSQTKILFTFQDAERGRWFRMERPLIEANHNGDVIEIYWSDFSMRPPIIPSDKITSFYKAYRCLADRMNLERSLWKFYLKPGDLVIFNNKRVLHGRDEYDASRVNRHLEGCYIDLQEAMSLFESLLVSNAT